MASLGKWSVGVAGVAVLVAVVVAAYQQIAHRGEIKSLTGVVLADAADPGKQFPVENAKITVSGLPRGSVARGTVTSDSSGLFHLPLRFVHAGDKVTLELR